jgi:hypothetical protein
MARALATCIAHLRRLWRLPSLVQDGIEHSKRAEAVAQGLQTQVSELRKELQGLQTQINLSFDAAKTKAQPTTATAVDPKLLEMPRARLFSSFDMDSRWGKPIFSAAMESEWDFAVHLLDKLSADGVPGDIVEFGVAGGVWLGRLAQWNEGHQGERNVYGFDSFKGLPEVTAADLDCWAKGMYCHDMDTVGAALNVANRPWLKLIKGWFSDTLSATHAQHIMRIAYARIDCDLHASAVDCLSFLSSRLANHSILVFDDWTYNPEKGETRAFLEWLPTVPDLQFETLLDNPLGHVYMRVHRRAQAVSQ